MLEQFPDGNEPMPINKASRNSNLMQLKEQKVKRTVTSTIIRQMNL